MTISSQSDHEQQKVQKKPLLLPSPSKGKATKAGTNMQVAKSTTLVNGKKKVETKTQQQIQIVNSKNLQIANYQSNSASPRADQQSIQQPTAQNIIFQQPAQQQQYPLILNQNGQIVQYIPADGSQNNSQLPYLTQLNGTNPKDVKGGGQSYIANLRRRRRRRCSRTLSSFRRTTAVISCLHRMAFPYFPCNHRSLEH